MTVDVEDYFQVQAFAACIDRTAWHRIAPRVEANVDRILEQFAAAGVSATFFTLGWIAERHQPMVRRIVAAGHELASHGYDHTRADAQDPATFAADVRRTRLLLEDIGGVAGARLSRRDLLDRRAQPLGIRRAGGGRLQLQFQRLSDQARPVRHARRAARAVPSRRRRAVGDPDDHGAGVRPQLAMLRRRLFPPAALQRVSSAASRW